VRAGADGTILVRGEPGHDRSRSLSHRERAVIDKPVKGAFYQTDLDLMLRNCGIAPCWLCA